MIRDEMDAINRPDCLRRSGLPHGYFKAAHRRFWRIAEPVLWVAVVFLLIFTY